MKKFGAEFPSATPQSRESPYRSVERGVEATKELLRNIGQDHIQIVRSLETIPVAVFQPGENSSREQVELQDASTGAHLLIERAVEDHGKHSSISIEVSTQNSAGEKERVVGYEISYPRKRYESGDSQADGIHYPPPEQRKWDFDWREFQRLLLKNRAFKAALERAMADEVSFYANADQARMERERIQRLLHAQEVVTDAEIFVRELQEWWDIAQVKELRKQAFPKELLPYLARVNATR